MKRPIRGSRIQAVLDIGIALIVAALPFIPPFHDEGEDIPVIPTVLVSSVIAAALVLRRRYPRVVLGVVLGLAIPVLVTGAHTVAFAAGAAMALYTVASRWPRRTTAIATAVTGITVVGLIVWTSEGEEAYNAGVTVMVWIALAAAVGDAVRSRRNYVQVLEDRAQRAEETREQMARTRVAEERLRIAQELHDIVAHHIAVVNIQAGLASRAMSRDAFGTAASAIDRVSEAARSALDDLSAVLRLLRVTEDTDQREPAPGLAQVSDLIQSYANADDRIHWSIRGKAVPLDAASELTAYRVIQEALTNATKHGVPGETHLTISYEVDGLDITVANPVRIDVEGNETTVIGTGYGVIGLHERVGSVGGRITAHRQPNGQFVVRAVIPYSPARPAEMEQTP